MARDGRKPVPTPLRALRGNPSKRPMPDALEVEAKLPHAPSHLSEEAKREWRRLGKLLLEVGLVSAFDRGLLAAWCSAWADVVEAELALRDEGPILRGENGPYFNPWASVREKAYARMLKIAPEFGLSPSARTRLTPPAPKAKDEFTEFEGTA